MTEAADQPEQTGLRALEKEVEAPGGGSASLELKNVCAFATETQRSL